MSGSDDSDSDDYSSTATYDSFEPDTWPDELKAMVDSHCPQIRARLSPSKVPGALIQVLIPLLVLRYNLHARHS